MCESVSRISSLQRWRLGGIYRPHSKTSRFLAVGILDTSDIGIACTAPMVTKLAVHARHRNSRRLLELPTPRTPDEPNQEHGEGCCSQANTGHIWYHTGHVWYLDLHHSELALGSLCHSILTWVGLSTYESKSINMMHPS